MRLRSLFSTLIADSLHRVPWNTLFVKGGFVEQLGMAGKSKAIPVRGRGGL
jgi:hypothetical protein